LVGCFQEEMSPETSCSIGSFNMSIKPEMRLTVVCGIFFGYEHPIRNEHKKKRIVCKLYVLH